MTLGATLRPFNTAATTRSSQELTLVHGPPMYQHLLMLWSLVACLTADAIALAEDYGRYGYRHIHALEDQAGWQVGLSVVKRIWRREGSRFRKSSRNAAMAPRQIMHPPAAASRACVVHDFVEDHPRITLLP